MNNRKIQLNGEILTRTKGSRKTSLAQVIIRKKTGDSSQFIVNKFKTLGEYFYMDHFTEKSLKPLKICNILNTYDIQCKVTGGGKNSQSEAIALALSRSLVNINGEFKALLKKNYCLRQDTRMVLPKQYGHCKARKTHCFPVR